MNVGTDEKVSQNQNLAKKLSIMLKIRVAKTNAGD